MTRDIVDLDAALAQIVWQGLLVLFRVAGLISLAPAFGEQSIPMRVKLGVAIAFAAILMPARFDERVVPPAFSAGILMLLGEVLIGLLAGLFLRLCVITLQIAGSVAAQATSLSHLVAGAGGEPLPAIGHVLVLAGLTLAIISGLPEALAQYVLLSYEMFPVGEWPSSTALVSLIISHVGNAFMLGFSLACPFVLIALVYNLVLGAINRAMPQLMVALVGAPAISFAALAMLAISAPFMIEVWRNTLFDLLTKGAFP